MVPCPVFPPPNRMGGQVAPPSLLFASYWQHFWGPASYLLGLCSFSDYQPHIYTYLPTYIPAYLHTYLPTYLHAYMPTCLHAYIHTYIPTYPHTYIPTYPHTYTATYTTYIQLTIRTKTGHPSPISPTPSTTTGHRGRGEPWEARLATHHHWRGRGGLVDTEPYLYRYIWYCICIITHTHIYILYTL